MSDLLTPWTVGCYDPRYVFDRHGEEVAFVHNRYELAVPQARLIAAAPELLAACRLALKVIEQSGMITRELLDADRELRDAIAKAEEQR